MVKVGILAFVALLAVAAPASSANAQDSYPDVPDWLARQGLQPYHLPPDAFSALVKSDMEKWGKVVRGSGIKAE